MEVGVASCEGRDACGRARNEVVVYDVGIALAGGITSYVAAAASPVIDHLHGRLEKQALNQISVWGRTYVVLEIIHALDFGIARLVVDVQVPEQTNTAIGLH